MARIPKIIHQIWSGINEPLPDLFRELGETWKENHPEWEYIVWDNRMMNDFIQEYYPCYWDVYNRFKYNIQRWDAIRYLILEKTGGMYVDFDYECLEPFDELLKDKTCCFSAEPDEHARIFNKEIYFNNALMASIPMHPFMRLIIESVFDETNMNREYPDRISEVLETTGPILLTNLYEKYDKKNGVYIIPAALVTPFSKIDIRNYLTENNTPDMELFFKNKMEDAIAVHYYIGTWM